MKPAPATNQRCEAPILRRSARRILSPLATATALMVLSLGVTMAQTNEAPQILFLHLKLKHNAISLVESNVAPGTLKPPRPAETGIRYELLSATGESLWQGWLDDPRERQIEYEDPPRSGKLKRKTFRREEAEFTMRVPVRAAAHRIEFHALEAPAMEATTTNQVRKLLGCLILNPEPHRAP
jgi:hypothetical protein